MESSKEDQYIESLSRKEKQAYEIAKSHLGSSFDLNKSLGFIKWLSELNETSTK